MLTIHVFLKLLNVFFVSRQIVINNKKLKKYRYINCRTQSSTRIMKHFMLKQPCLKIVLYKSTNDEKCLVTF